MMKGRIELGDYIFTGNFWRLFVFYPYHYITNGPRYELIQFEAIHLVLIIILMNTPLVAMLVMARRRQRREKAPGFPVVRSE